MKKWFSFLSLLLLVGCSGLEDSEKEKLRRMNAIGEVIYRSSEENLYPISEPKRMERENYPWEDTYVGNHVKVTKEYFRCRGGQQNPPQMKGESYLFDCGGMQQHSLPLQGGKEFIYPALIDLLNFIQEKTRKKVVITCGHRCPTHNTYSDDSRFNQTSKHMLGAEVDFYVKGWEWSPEKVIKIIQAYYREDPRFEKDERFTVFHRFESETNVTTLPWYNKEIFVKLFKKDEGRDLDNSHRFPYISIQLKWDRDQDGPITYSWSKAFNGYLRY